ncbi:hypothetical protein KY284_011012 [Solanum tuberosum]|nr:hypothetical protein KY284_011012 [Solanum tuberosum]
MKQKKDKGEGVWFHYLALVHRSFELLAGVVVEKEWKNKMGVRMMLRRDEEVGVLFSDDFRVVPGEIRGRRWLLCLVAVAWCYLFVVTVELAGNGKRKRRKCVWGLGFDLLCGVSFHRRFARNGEVRVHKGGSSEVTFSPEKEDKNGGWVCGAWPKSGVVEIGKSINSETLGE